MLLQDKIALVYGAGGAIGGAAARAFAREGAHVVLAGRTEDSLRQTHDAIAEAGGRATVSPVDALDADAVAAQVAEIASTLGPVGVMVNAVGFGDTQGQLLSEMPWERFDGPLRTAMRAWFVTGGELSRHMAAHGGGTIVGITANAGRVPIGMVGGFGVICAAVEHYLRQLAVEMGPAGVRAVCVRSAGSPDAPG